MSRTNEDTRTPRGNFRGKHTPQAGYQPLNHWVVCDSCGFDIRAKDIRETWDGRLVCPSDWETRHPQDFVRSKHDDQSAKGPVRLAPPDIIIVSGTPCAIVGEAIIGEMIVGVSGVFCVGEIPSGTFDNTL